MTVKEKVQKALRELSDELETYYEMMENEPSHENMFDIGQSVAEAADTLKCRLQTYLEKEA